MKHLILDRRFNRSHCMFFFAQDRKLVIGLQNICSMSPDTNSNGKQWYVHYNTGYDRLSAEDAERLMNMMKEAK